MRNSCYSSSRGPLAVEENRLAEARASQMMSGWGLKFFDNDNDGNLDLFIANGHPDDLIDKISPGVTQAGDLKQSRMKVGGGSYLSSRSTNVLGIGKREKMDWLEVKWPLPGGATQRLTGLPVNRYITIVER